MNFAEVRFWEYLLVGLGVLVIARFSIALARPTVLPVFDKLALLTLGLSLLVCMSWVTFLIFLVVAVGTYFGLAWIISYHARHASKYLLLLIPLQLLPLFYTKYANFVGNYVLGFNLELLARVTIPVGISFYTFQKIAFVVDTLAFKHPMPRFLDYMNFAGFFPQIVAGPIERRADLLAQMEAFRFRWLPENLNAGASWIALGFFFKCCLADNLKLLFNRSSETNPFLVWLANILFGLRIYYDFAGYSLIAVGLARCLGIKLTLNFLSPYCSTSIVEFWHRWHITLSQWFRDYVYVPLGGNRVRFWALNIMIVFVVSGIWHGAGWNFVLWGFLHGSFLIANRLSTRLSVPRPIAWAFTMAASFFAWLCFYETNNQALWTKLKLLLTPDAYRSSALKEALASYDGGDRFTLGCMLILAIATLIAEWLSVRRRNEPYHYLRHPVALMILVIFTVLLAPGKSNGFIYFAF